MEIQIPAEEEAGFGNPAPPIPRPAPHSSPTPLPRHSRGIDRESSCVTILDVILWLPAAIDIDSLIVDLSRLHQVSSTLWAVMLRAVSVRHRLEDLFQPY